MLAITEPRHAAKAPEDTLKTDNPTEADCRTAAAHRRGGGSSASWLLQKQGGKCSHSSTRLKAEPKGPPISALSNMADPVGASLLAITEPRHAAKAPEETLKTVNPTAADSRAAAAHRRGGGSPASWLLRKRCGERAHRFRTPCRTYESPISALYDHGEPRRSQLAGDPEANAPREGTGRNPENCQSN